MTRSLRNELGRLEGEYGRDRSVSESMPSDERAALRQRIGRQRQQRIVSLSAVVIASLGALAFGATAIADHVGEPAQPISDGGFVGIEWNDFTIASPYGAEPICGAPAPTPTYEADGLTLTILEAQPGVYYDTTILNEDGSQPLQQMTVRSPDGSASGVTSRTVNDLIAMDGAGSPVTYDGVANPQRSAYFFAGVTTTNPTTTAHVSPVGSVLVRDDVIVGWQPAMSVGSYVELTEGGTAIAGNSAPTDTVYWCSGGTATLQQLPVGEYEVYQFVHVVSSPAVAALAARVRSGGDLFDYPRDLYPGASAGTWWCEYQNLGRSVPMIECDPDVVIEQGTSIATLPYPAGSYVVALDAVLVSGPRSLTLVNPRTWSIGADEGIPFPAEPACGNQFDMAESGVGLRIAIPLERLWRDDAPTTFASQVMPPDLSGPGTVSIGQPLEVWITRVFPIARADNPNYWADQHEEIVGHALLTLNDDEPFELNEITGPARPEAAVTDLQWCPGIVPEADGANKTRVYVRGTVAWDTGEGPHDLWTLTSVDHQSWD